MFSCDNKLVPAQPTQQNKLEFLILETNCRSDTNLCVGTLCYCHMHHAYMDGKLMYEVKIISIACQILTKQDSDGRVLQLATYKRPRNFIDNTYLIQNKKQILADLQVKL